MTDDFFISITKYASLVRGPLRLKSKSGRIAIMLVWKFDWKLIILFAWLEKKN